MMGAERLRVFHLSCPPVYHNENRLEWPSYALYYQNPVRLSPINRQNERLTI